MTIRPDRTSWMRTFLFLSFVLGNGCVHSQRTPPSDPNAPNELAKVILPEYVINSPDILKVDALQLVPLPPYRVQALDILAIRVTKTLSDEPISGLYSVEPDGTVTLGTSYGAIKIIGLTIEEAKKTIKAELSKILKEPSVEITIAQGRGVQQIRGEHLVRPDGTVSLGSYGSVQVAGLTLSQAKSAIEGYLTQYLQKPEITVDVLAYNSKVYYVIYDQGGAGQRIFRLPITGNETVLDAVSQLTGLSPVSDQKQIWVARPALHNETEQVLPVDWNSIVMCGTGATNYQLFPGDRLFVKANPLIRIDTKVARVISPMERIFGFALLGGGTVQTLRFNSTSGGTTVP